MGFLFRCPWLLSCAQFCPRHLTFLTFALPAPPPAHISPNVALPSGKPFDLYLLTSFSVCLLLTSGATLYPYRWGGGSVLHVWCNLSLSYHISNSPYTSRSP